MSSFLTFTLVNLRHQLRALALEEELYPERKPQIERVRYALETSLRRTLQQRQLEKKHGSDIALRQIRHEAAMGDYDLPPGTNLDELNAEIAKTQKH